MSPPIMRVFLLVFIQYGNRQDMSNSLFGKIIHYSITYLPQFVNRVSLFVKISVLNSLFAKQKGHYSQSG